MKYSLDGNDTDIVSALIDKKVNKEKYRKILKLRFVDGLTYEEIAHSGETTITSPRQVGKIISDYAPLLMELIQK